MERLMDWLREEAAVRGAAWLWDTIDTAVRGTEPAASGGGTSGTRTRRSRPLRGFPLISGNPGPTPLPRRARRLKEWQVKWEEGREGMSEGRAVGERERRGGLQDSEWRGV